MKKQILVFVLIFILWIVWYIRYTRPLSLPIQDPGEEMFKLPSRTLPSAWPMMDKVFQSRADTTPSETGRILIEKVDKKLTQYSSVHSGVYTYGGSGELLSIDQEKIINTLSWSEVRWFVDYKLQQTDDLITKYDIVVPEWSDYATAIPSWMGEQAIVRLWSAYAYIDCTVDRIDQCRTTYDILFRFSQKMKDGWTLIQTLMGSSMESIVLNHIKYLLQNDPIKYNPLKQMLQQNQYIWPEKVFQNAMKTEYRIYKNRIQSIDIMNNWNTSTMDIINVVWSDDWNKNIWIVDRWIQTFLWFVLPKSLLFNQQQTDEIARYFYWQSLGWVNIFADDKNLHDYWTGPIWSRPNMIGRIILEAIIPRLTWIQKRLQDMERLYISLIQ